MNFVKKVLFIVLILILVPTLVAGASVLFPYQGGTGIGSVTSGDIGKFLAVSSTNPFAYKLVTVSGGGSTTSTLQDVTTNGNTTTNSIQFAGGTSTAAFTIQGLLTAPTGSFTYIDATTTNATFAIVGTLTGSNATITNVSSTNMSVSSSLLVAGTFGLTGAATLGSTLAVTGISTLATTSITALSITGNTTGTTAYYTGLTVAGTSDLQGAVFIGTSGATVNGGVTAVGVTTTNLFATSATITSITSTNHNSTNYTGTNATLTNVTSTNLFATTSTFTNLVVTAAITGGSLAISGNVTIGGTLGVTGVTTLATTTVTNFTASRTSTLATTTITSLSVNGVSYPSAAGSAGQIFRSNGTNFALSTSIWPDTTTINQILYSSAANTISGITTANSGVLVTNGSGVPSIATDIPTAVTIGSSYIYRVGGTDVSVADGGSGASSFTANGVLLGNGTSAFQVTATGTSGQVLTSNGGGSAPTFQSLPAVTYASTTFSGSVSISSTSYLDTGISLTLPSAGTYRVGASVRGFLLLNSGSSPNITARFYNSTDSSAIADSDTLVVLAGTTGLPYISTAWMERRITVTGSKTIKLQAKTEGGTTFSARDIQGDGAGWTTMFYEKIY